MILYQIKTISIKKNGVGYTLEKKTSKNCFAGPKSASSAPAAKLTANDHSKEWQLMSQENTYFFYNSCRTRHLKHMFTLYIDF